MDLHHPHDWDVLVVGRSFAGLSAALTLGRARRSVLAVGTGGPRNEAVGHAHGLLSRDHESPLEIVAASERQLERYPNIELVDDRVLGIETIGGVGTDGPPGFVAHVGKRTVSAAAVVLATGVNDDPMPITGLAEHWGRGVYTCPFCDGWEHAGAAIAVVGDPAFAPHSAQLLTGWSGDVTAFVGGLAPEATAALAAKGVRVEERGVVRVVGDGSAVTAVELEDGTVVDVGAVFHAVMPRPNHALAVSLGCDIDDFGFVVADEMRRTTVPGVWGVGDLVGRRHQMSIAIADGAIAGSDIVAAFVMGGH